MRTADFDFPLPPGLIAQIPAAVRDESRLLVLHRSSGAIEHRRFRHLPDYLKAGDVLVLNNSRVIPARLRGRNARTGGAFELLLIEENGVNDWWVMLRPGKRARIGTQIRLTAPQYSTLNTPPPLAAVVDKNNEGHRRVRFTGVPNILDVLDFFGEVPLPPYIRRPSGLRGAAADEPAPLSHPMEEGRGEGFPVSHHPRAGADDRHRYQTVFADPAGSVAAPTAGLHFTTALLDEIRSRDVQVCFVTLHVGLGTFAPVKTETVSAHQMHEERCVVSEDAARIINDAKRAGRRVIAVGTTTVRVLESLAGGFGVPPSGGSSGSPHRADAENLSSPFIAPGTGRTRIFIYPPHEFRIADALLTNFHLPRSTLLMLVSAFAAPGEERGRDLLLSAYAEAVRERYRFFSYGDAMLIL